MNKLNFWACLTVILFLPMFLASGAVPPKLGQVKPTQEGQKISIDKRVQALTGTWEGERHWKKDKEVKQRMRWRIEVQGTDWNWIRVTQLDEDALLHGSGGFAPFGKAADSIFWSSNCELHSIYFIPATSEPRIGLLRKAVIGGKIVDQWVQMKKIS